MRASRPPWDELLSGAPPSGAGAQRAVMLALLAKHYRLVVEGCVRPDQLNAVGIEATESVRDVPATWLRVPHPFQRLPQCSSGPSLMGSSTLALCQWYHGTVVTGPGSTVIHQWSSIIQQ